MTAPSLTILIPCLNEEVAIPVVVAEYQQAFPQARILVVDNGSTDATSARARAAGADVLVESRRGKAKAVATALSHINTDLVLMVDGDGSYPAAGGKLLYERYCESPVDMITGVRQTEQDVFRPGHQWGTSLFASFVKAVFGHQPGDVFSGLRLFSRRFYMNAPVLSRGFELEIELTIQAIDKGFSTVDLPIPFGDRAEGTSSKLKTFRDGTRILRVLLVLFRDYRPMRFFGLIAACGFLLGALAGALPVYEFIQTAYVSRVPMAILAASIMVISTVVLLVGLILESNLRHHREMYHIRLRGFGMQSRS
ncbi:glycosyltransferase family 2 protein [Prosthecobacter vanneervenii]|uniref:Glycosyltransferase involved in cell wall biosynthesis n=1 Tax=Prosthecobacter vanneervenii TaxID=48466 RepID=A0A7W7Y6G4_9BACT|nr:glycosyltransferase family 2 protein [Prosthecobacter vanneervenii]MBB5030481.1 glycosyltransferase involved in cell wall biosynthesis [Prosthecobacter vanneervenii]